MKKIIIPFLIFFSLFVVGSSVLAANSITSRLKGKLLLQVQDKGRIWYVDPVGLQKHEVTFANALSLFQKLALGITNADLIKIPADLDSLNPNLDSDNDGYPDKEELQNGYSPYIPGSNKGRFKTDNNLATKLKGRLLLQVQDKGRIWYIDQNGKRWEVTWGNLMSLFRKLALGITDKDLNEVGGIDTSGWLTYINNQQGYEIKYPSSWSDGLEVKYVGNQTYFYLPSYDNRKGQAFCIGRKTITQWEADYQKFLRGEGPFIADELKRNGEYVFYSCVSLSAETFTVLPNPYDTDILSTFHFID